MSKRYICVGLLILSLAFLIFGTCVKFEKNGLAIVDELLDMADYIGIFSDDAGSGSVFRDVKQFSSSIADGKLSGGEAWLDTFRVSNVMKAFDMEEDLRSVSQKLLPFQIIFPIVVLCGAAACAGFLLDLKHRPVLVYLILLAGMLLAFMVFKPDSFQIGTGLFLALAAAGGAVIADSKVTIPVIPRAAAAPRSGRPVGDSGAKGRSDFSRIKDNVMKRAGYVPEKEAVSFCGNCGNAIGGRDVFCGRCGKKIVR